MGGGRPSPSGGEEGDEDDGQQQPQALLQAHSSKWRGVAYNKKCRKWQAVINTNGRHVHLGTFVDEDEAALAFDKAAVICRGTQAKLNFPLLNYTRPDGTLIHDREMEQRLINALSSPLVKRPRNRMAPDGGSGSAASDSLAAQAPPSKQQRTAAGLRATSPVGSLPAGGGLAGAAIPHLGSSWPMTTASGGGMLLEEPGVAVGEGGMGPLAALGQPGLLSRPAGLMAALRSSAAATVGSKVQQQHPAAVLGGGTTQVHLAQPAASLGLDMAWSIPASTGLPKGIGAESPSYVQQQQQDQQQQEQQVMSVAAAGLQVLVQAALPPGCQLVALMCAEPSLVDAPLATAAIVFSTPSGATGAALWHAGRLHAMRRFATPSQAADHCEALLEVAIALMRGGVGAGLPLAKAGLLPDMPLSTTATAAPSAAAGAGRHAGPPHVSLLRVAAASQQQQQPGAALKGRASDSGGMVAAALLQHGAAAHQLLRGAGPVLLDTAGPGEGLTELAAAATATTGTGTCAAGASPPALPSLCRTTSAASGGEAHVVSANGGAGTAAAAGGRCTPRSAHMVPLRLAGESLLPRPPARGNVPRLAQDLASAASLPGTLSAGPTHPPVLNLESAAGGGLLLHAAAGIKPELLDPAAMRSRTSSPRQSAGVTAAASTSPRLAPELLVAGVLAQVSHGGYSPRASALAEGSSVSARGPAAYPHQQQQQQLSLEPAVPVGSVARVSLAVAGGTGAGTQVPSPGQSTMSLVPGGMLLGPAAAGQLVIYTCDMAMAPLAGSGGPGSGGGVALAGAHAPHAVTAFAPHTTTPLVELQRHSPAPLTPSHQHQHLQIATAEVGGRTQLVLRATPPPPLVDGASSMLESRQQHH